ncbi:uncharacterized protein LOC142979464 [Anticarsia gemmatalis]|uniref:uncharacterized protein LOC142979464 n=1 Tax=Anticarsia gemmatalis TaxID=129554 RepID=UPI003F7721A8
MAPYTGTVSPDQIEMLLNFLQDHKELARGQLRSCEGKVKARRLWQELCTNLNSMGGCTKTVKQWQKVWFDKKHIAKKAAANSRRSSAGGGPSSAPSLSQWEERVISIIEDGFGLGQASASVSTFYDTADSNPPSSSQASLPQAPKLEHIDFSEPSSPSSIDQPIESPRLTTSSRSQSTRPRTRRLAPPGSTIRRLLAIEEGRVATERQIHNELTGIRVALVDLCGLFRDYLNRN